MKKLLTIVAGFAVAVAAIVAISGSATPVSADSCVDGTKYTDFDGSRTGNDTLTVWPKKKLCKDANVNFTTFEVLNKNYNGKPFSNNPTALPQAKYWNKTVTLKKGSTSKVTVKMTIPNACTPYQIDAYVGPVQTKITTSAGLVNTTAIVAKIFDKTKTDCTPPAPKMVKVCNPATGEIITVKESDASKYKPVGDKACQPVKVCNPANGQIITVPAKDASKYKPVDDEACKPKPGKVQVCNPANGQIITVDEDKADQYKPVDDEACSDVQVCNPETGEIITVSKSQAGNYKPVDDAACQETPGKGGETPEELPSTGPAEAVSALFGVGSLAGASTAYIRARRTLRK